MLWQCVAYSFSTFGPKGPVMSISPSLEDVDPRTEKGLVVNLVDDKVYEYVEQLADVLEVAQQQREAEELAPRWRLGAPARAGPRAEGREP